MRIIEIAALSNGAHRNQMTKLTRSIPEGWAVIPSDMECKNFPFGDVTVEESNGILTVTSWTPGTIPEVEPDTPEPTTDERVTTLEEENAMLKAQIAAQSDQMDFYEECIVEMAAIVYA